MSVRTANASVDALVRSLQSGAPDGVFTLRADGSLETWDDRCRGATGWDAEALNREEGEAGEALAAFTRRTDGRFAGRYEVQAPTAGRGRRWFEVTHLPVADDAEGRSVGLLREIHASKQVECDLADERDFLQSAIDAFPSPIKIIDRQFRIVHVNRASEEWTGQGRDQLCGKNCYAQFYGGRAPCPFCQTSRAFAGEAVQHNFSSTDTEGRMYYGQIHAFPIRDSQGQVRYVLEITQDLTREKLIEEQLLQSAKLASLGEVATGIAHEVRNPLTGIRLGLDALGEAVRDQPENAATIRSIVNDIERLNTVVTQLLDFAKKKPAVRMTLNLNRLIERTVRYIQRQARQQGIGIHVDLCPDCDTLKADPDQIQQVFLNILLNAVQAMPSGGALSIQCEYREQLFRETRHDGIPGFRVTITDTGCGISPEVKDRLFDPFFTTKSNGTGLGLSVSYRYVKEQGGNILFESQPGKGTRVIVLLPKCPLEQNA